MSRAKDSKPMNRHIEIEQLLASHRIRPTANRIIVCRYLNTAPGPLSVAEMEEALETIDRSTITRTVATLLGAHLLHRVDDGSGSMKYELCRDTAHPHDEPHEHTDIHPHFYCRECHRTVCLHSAPLVMPQLPEGCVAEDANFVITGICADCARRMR